MDDLLLNEWNWWILAAVLLILEIFLPGVVFLWLGIAAALVGSLLLIWPELDWQWQLFWFAVFSVANILLFMRFFKREAIPESDHPLLNRRSEQYIGRHFFLQQNTVNFESKIKINDSLWKVRTDGNYPEGTEVEVTSVEGALLIVRRVALE